MRRSTLALAALGIGACAVTAAFAQNADAIAARQALMKRSGQQIGIVTRMMRGQEPFDAAKVNAAFDAWADKAQKLPDVFPDNSRTGQTRALSRIWEDRPTFLATVAKFNQDVATNRAKGTAGVEGLKEAVPAVLDNCNGCHENFRRPQS